MSATVTKVQCIKCGKGRATSKCSGCLRDFCYNHLTNHRQELNQELRELETNRDLFRQTLNEYSIDSQKESLIKQIDQWEYDSIETIQQTAKLCKQTLIEYTTENINQIEINLRRLTEKMREIREENDINEIDLKQITDKLKQLTEQLDELCNISIHQISSLLINNRNIVKSSQKRICSFDINNNAKWKQDGLTIAGGNGEGNQLNQLCFPDGICLNDDDQTMYICDYGNHRIVRWKCDSPNGDIIADGNAKVNQTSELKYPTNLILDKTNDALIICDWGNNRIIQKSISNLTDDPKILIAHIDCSRITMDDIGDIYISDTLQNEVKRWRQGNTMGTIVAGGNDKGNDRNQFNSPTYLIVDKDHSIYVADHNNHRVMKWIKDAKEGIVVAGGEGKGNSLTQLSYPCGIILDDLGNLYIADSDNNRIVCWPNGSEEGTVIIGGNGQGKQANQLDHPTDLSIDREGHLIVVDSYNHRIQKFIRDLN
ncbi:unnamed protein product [Adineta steineri]|uniref:SMP-30/Gluconolactonase/LRE-like region domain-containing protein n=1 Tax=Adineta steineri TaxID=433720 RepID=A0A819VTW4_9BILA|nr:unnamed protein product [Adineta steineri]CAF4114251.1 unnamed protein product [Adineta steineri]